MPFRRTAPLALVIAVTLAACGGGDDDAAVDAGTATDDSSVPGDANVTGDSLADGAVDDPGLPADGDDGDASDLAAGGGATRPWIAGEWQLVSATSGGETLALPVEPVSMSIIAPDEVNGSAGCNSFGGQISAPFGDGDFGDLSFSKMAITEMACEPIEVMDFEASYMEALGNADAWELSPPTGLVFRGEGIELVYEIGDVPAPATDE